MTLYGAGRRCRSGHAPKGAVPRRCCAGIGEAGRGVWQRGRGLREGPGAAPAGSRQKAAPGRWGREGVAAPGAQVPGHRGLAGMVFLRETPTRCPPRAGSRGWQWLWWSLGRGWCPPGVGGGRLLLWGMPPVPPTDRGMRMCRGTGASVAGGARAWGHSPLVEGSCRVPGVHRTLSPPPWCFGDLSWVLGAPTPGPCLLPGLGSRVGVGLPVLLILVWGSYVRLSP